jgi:nucleoside-diphosphate kinase
MIERTLAIIKPDGVKRNLIGEVVKRFEEKGLKVVGMKMLSLTRSRAEGFYKVHVGKPFFNDLCSFMSSGAVVAMVLEGEGAVMRTREVMGATNPKDARPGTIRRDLALGHTENTVHGSDSPETARWEIGFFFGKEELIGG